MWRYQVGDEPGPWRALAVTDRFIVTMDLSVDEAATAGTVARLVRFAEVTGCGNARVLTSAQ